MSEGMTEHQRETNRLIRFNMTIVVAGVIAVTYLIVQGCNYQADKIRDIYLETGATPRVHEGKLLPPAR